MKYLFIVVGCLFAWTCGFVAGTHYQTSLEPSLPHPEWTTTTDPASGDIHLGVTYPDELRVDLTDPIKTAPWPDGQVSNPITVEVQGVPTEGDAGRIGLADLTRQLKYWPALPVMLSLEYALGGVLRSR